MHCRISPKIAPVCRRSAKGATLQEQEKRRTWRLCGRESGAEVPPPWLVDLVQFHADRRNDFLFPGGEVGVVCPDLGQSFHAESLLFKGCEGFDQAAEGV